MDDKTLEITLERLQRIEASQFRTEAMLRTLIRDINYVPDVPQAPNLSVIKTTH
jgi:hypothetical protein